MGRISRVIRSGENQMLRGIAKRTTVEIGGVLGGIVDGVGGPESAIAVEDVEDDGEPT